ncbi:MAG: hypothetical protein E6G41_10675, partial [Actinobacteria bacterium]
MRRVGRAADRERDVAPGAIRPAGAAAGKRDCGREEQRENTHRGRILESRALTTRGGTLMEDRGLAAYAAEFIGTLLLVLFIGSILSTATGLGVTDWAVIGLLHVFVLAMLIATLGGTSGAHFNPAITVALAAARKIKPPDAVIYIVLQLAGAIVGALIVKLIFKDEGHGNYGTPSVSDKWLQGKNLSGMFVEMVGTFALVWAVFGAAVNVRAERAWAPWIIGGTLGAMVMCFGPLTGAGFNPARSIGPAIVAGSPDWSQLIV